MARRNQDENDTFPMDAAAGPDPMKVGGGYLALGWLGAIGWIVGLGAAVQATYGFTQVLAAPPAAQAAVAALMALPAFLFLFSAAALREGARGRAQARLLADAAERMLSPSPTAEAEARRMGVSVRGEIAALDRALDQTLQKVREVEAVIARQTMAVDSAAAMAQAGARSIVGGLERERNDLLQIADDLNHQATSIGQAISRHTRLIADAARLAEAEVRAADEALDSRLSSFGAAAALISDRTHALTKAAQASAESALRLETALSTALDSLAQATALTDAAKKSAETATFAANATAGAVRETTLRAVEDAKRAADLIRAEAASVERAGIEAIERLRDVAAEARQGQPAPRTEPAAEAPRERRRTDPGAGPRDPSMSETFAHNRPDSRPEPRVAPPRAPEEPRTPEGARWTWRDVIAAIDDESKGADADRRDEDRRTEDRRVEDRRVEDRRNDDRVDLGRPDLGNPDGDRPGRPIGLQGFAPNAAEADEPLQTRRPPADPGPQRPAWGFATRSPFERNPPTLDPSYDRFRAADPNPDDLSRSPQRPQLQPQTPEAALIAGAGVTLADVFSPNALERISQRAKSGTQARRRAVREAASEAVLRLAEHLDQSADARAAAAAFLRAEGARISELLGRGRAPLGSETTRAFLLIDAASA